MYHQPEVEREMCRPIWQAQAPSPRLLLCAMIATAIVSLSLVPAPHPSLQPAQIRSTATPSIAPTLLFYVFVATDAEYPANLNFFLAHAARADDGVDYVVVFQSDDAADLRPTRGSESAAVGRRAPQPSF